MARSWCKALKIEEKETNMLIEKELKIQNCNENFLFYISISCLQSVLLTQNPSFFMSSNLRLLKEF